MGCSKWDLHFLGNVFLVRFFVRFFTLLRRVLSASFLFFPIVFWVIMNFSSGSYACNIHLDIILNYILKIFEINYTVGVNSRLSICCLMDMYTVFRQYNMISSKPIYYLESDE